ncbi:hypothetical protein JVX91_09085 [Pseudomonas sp. PDNC002]|uniref:hypothetical protein n=1 Tax=Pseudomonas sp. PDNC002 TaxID=2811422 RepID=UPI00196519A6|nr:hypothetical protein [Pseudomonas sp. PDNC002]QRY81237.1 hypothetical protein JVX91_09085 [Pseudomonas sp. PDNC002]
MGLSDPGQRHYELAMHNLESLREHLLCGELAPALDLLAQLSEQVQQAYWQASLHQRITRESVGATPYCREIALGPHQQMHVDELRLGMLAAERSLNGAEGPAPWNGLIHGRNRVKSGLARYSYECGFVLRLFQLIQEFAAHIDNLPRTSPMWPFRIRGK